MSESYYCSPTYEEFRNNVFQHCGVLHIQYIVANELGNALIITNSTLSNVGCNW